MRRVIGIDTHRTFGEVVFWEQGRLRRAGRVDMTRTALEGFGKSLLASDEVVIEATGNCMAVSRVLSPFVKRVVIANPLQVKAIAHAHVKTDKIDAGTLANLYAAGYLPEVWMPDAVTERNRRLNTALSARPSSYAGQERSARDPLCSSDPQVSSRRSVRAPRSCLAGPTALARR
jgi:transposase